MAILTDLIDKPISELTEEELEQRIFMLKRARLVKEASTRPPRKSNKQKRTDSVLKDLTPEQLAHIEKMLKEEGLL